jgi:hypothetical protein
VVFTYFEINFLCYTGIIMKRIMVLLFLIVFILTPYQIFASEDVVRPPSRFYFLQTWGEEIRLFFTRSTEQKIAYLTTLTIKRVEEMQKSPSFIVADRYENHYRKLGQLVKDTENKDLASKNIREANIAQQQALAKVYNQVPESAQEAVLRAQGKSSQHVAQTIEAIEGPVKSQEFVQQVAQIQQAERAGRVEQAPRENNPNADPAENSPKELKGSQPLKDGQPLNLIKQVEEGAEEGSENQAAPMAPVQIEQPVGQD